MSNITLIQMVQSNHLLEKLSLVYLSVEQ